MTKSPPRPPLPPGAGRGANSCTDATRDPKKYRFVVHTDPWTARFGPCSHRRVTPVPAVSHVTESSMSRAVPALVLTGLLAGAQLFPQAATGVVVNQSWAIPSDGTIVLGGHGFGHGHGMSQYGAEGAARQGKTWREILKFYYPGTAFDTN